MFHIQGRALRAMAALCLLFASGVAAAAAPIDKPFAEARVVLQISDADPSKQTLVLNVANNLIKHYGPDKVDVEIVAFGPGLRLLFDGNANSDRIASLAGNGVRFAACSNTVRNMSRLLESDVRLNSAATRVDAGVVRIVDLVASGYTLVKP